MAPDIDRLTPLYAPAARRLGFFDIAGPMVRARAPEVTRALGACAVYAAAFVPADDCFVYLANCRHFRVLPAKEAPPYYHWVFGTDMEAVEMYGMPWNQTRATLYLQSGAGTVGDIARDLLDLFPWERAQ